MTKPLHEALPLRTVSRLTGLTADVIRAWERRYGVVDPQRGPRGARLYSAAEVERLRLLARVVAAGRAIGDVANLSVAELARLAAVELLEATEPTERRGIADPAGESIRQAFAALKAFDLPALDRCLAHALIALGAREFAARVVHPLLEEVGEHWADGRLSIADEHLLSAALRNLLSGLLGMRAANGGPTVLLATPSGERHEFGLLLAALMVADAGVGLCYLGTDLPAAEICAAARRANALVVGLGVVNGDNEAAAVVEVRRVAQELPAPIELWLGGRQAAAVAKRLGRRRAVVLDRSNAIERELARVRAANAPKRA